MRNKSCSAGEDLLYYDNLTSTTTFISHLIKTNPFLQPDLTLFSPQYVQRVIFAVSFKPQVHSNAIFLNINIWVMPSLSSTNVIGILWILGDNVLSNPATKEVRNINSKLIRK
jgi:hypothetical protein